MCLKISIHHLLQAYNQVSKTEMVSIVTDEVEESSKLDILIENAYKNLRKRILDKTYINSNFYAEAGNKIFRDFVYKAKCVFVADHRYYKRIKFYDFVNKNPLKNSLYYFGYLLLKINFIRKEFDKKIIVGMVDKSKKVIEKSRQKN